MELRWRKGHAPHWSRVWNSAPWLSSLFHKRPKMFPLKEQWICLHLLLPRSGKWQVLFFFLKCAFRFYKSIVESILVSNNWLCYIAWHSWWLCYMAWHSWWLCYIVWHSRLLFYMVWHRWWLCYTAWHSWLCYIAWQADDYVIWHGTDDYYVIWHDTADVYVIWHGIVDDYVTWHGTADDYVTWHGTADDYVTWHFTTDNYGPFWTSLLTLLQNKTFVTVNTQQWTLSCMKSVQLANNFFLQNQF